MQTHKDLIVWKESMQFVKQIYAATAKFPKDEIYGLISQLRRAVVSIPVNISEGAARNSKKEYIHFLYISLGSISEVETLLLIAGDQDYVQADQFLKTIEDLRKKLLNLIKYLKGK
ncbi:MAG: four helix bundle protein [Acidobacteria bacterium]|nr:four helix bundle protein [Acidobacteriota bacterium]MBU4307776.1 four helix bundle protein [Acidobacteriota bacterium]MBU4400988.1 four helix bundle protein [Planctomycetota bacterium]MCG2810386.1 four helix bundle protein [Candidatus Aminicenantes bacterium]